MRRYRVAFQEYAMKWLVNLIYDPEYKGYVADVPELPGCMSQGKTVESALENVKEAIELHLESLPRRKKNKQPAPALTTTVEV
jgi:predicted RNase H-like HicB family nuclease